MLRIVEKIHVESETNWKVGSRSESEKNYFTDTNYTVEKSSMSTFGYCLPAVAKTARKCEEREIWKRDQQQEMEEISSIAGYSDAGP